MIRNAGGFPEGQYVKRFLQEQEHVVVKIPDDVASVVAGFPDAQGQVTFL